MARGLTEKKFEANVPLPLWEAYEQWAQRRAKIPNTQLMEALFRLFLAAPESIKLLALYGRTDQVETLAQMREDLLAAAILDAAEADEAATAERMAGREKALKPTDGKRRRKTG